MVKNRVLLLEDDLTLSETVKDYFEENNFVVDCCYDGEEALSCVYEQHYDILLLDVNVPRLNGFEVLKTIRKEKKSIPAIFITSLNSMDSLEEGFDSGCNDYIRKPFDLKELLLRVKMILKREVSHDDDNILDMGSGVKYNPVSHEITKNGEEIKLNYKELKLLKLFVQNKNELISHETIYSHVWEYEEEASDNSLRTYIKNLRRIFGKDKIVSIKKFGYKFKQD